MAKKVLLIGIVAALLIVSFVFLAQQTFLPSGTQVILPRFGSYECAGDLELRDHPSLQTQSFFRSNSASYVCGEGLFAPEGCTYSLTVSNERNDLLTIKDCPRTTEQNPDDCVTLSKPSSGTIIAELDTGRRLFVHAGGTGTSYSVDVREKTKAYRLRTQVEGFLTSKGGCTLNDLTSVAGSSVTNEEKERMSQKLVKYWDGSQHLRPNEIVNFITSRVKAESANLVTISGINNGEPIYVAAPRSYYKTERLPDGTYVYVGNPIYDERIECYPANILGCDSNAQSKVVEEGVTECPVGVAPGYTPVTADKSCRVECVSGKVQFTNDCVDRIDRCPSDKPNYNTLIGQCEAVTQETDEQRLCTLRGGSWVDKETTDCGFVCSLGFTNPTITKEGFCKSKVEQYLPLIAIGAIVLIAFFAFGGIEALRKKRGGK